MDLPTKSNEDYKHHHHDFLSLPTGPSNEPKI